jgi:ribonuclease P protein component
MNKKNRIKKNTDFDRVFREGTSTANRKFVLYLLQRQKQNQYRIGLSVSKKLGNAVVRNHIKRYIRQAVLEMKEQLQNDYDYVIIARKPCVEMPFDQFKSSLNHVLKRAKALKIDNQKNLISRKS